MMNYEDIKAVVMQILDEERAREAIIEKAKI
jgi:hypothetical protein